MFAERLKEIRNGAGMTQVQVENSFDGAVPIRKGGTFPATTKQSILSEIITEHGIGLENVRDIAERYFGGVNIKGKGDVFHQMQSVKSNHD